MGIPKVIPHPALYRWVNRVGWELFKVSVRAMWRQLWMLGPRSYDALCTLYHGWWPPRREAQFWLWRAWLPLTGSGLLLPPRCHARCYPHLCTYHPEHF